MHRFRTFINILLSSILVWLAGCDCHIEVNGRVVSSLNNEPIVGAKIVMVNRNIAITSDSKGKFSIGEHTGFCYDPVIEVSEASYKTFRVLIKDDSEFSRYQVTSSLQDVSFDEPFYPDSADRRTYIVATSINQYSQDFKVKSDSLIVFLEEDNLEEEIESVKKSLMKAYGRGRNPSVAE